MAKLNDGSTNDDCQEQWRKAFSNTFLKVDAEIGGEANAAPIAPETVGSTAAVAIVCSSHIIVANCGDSRVVLCRGKEPLALSVDHKVTFLFSYLHLAYSNFYNSPKISTLFYFVGA